MENKSILIVEDNAVFHRHLKAVFQNDYNCIIAVNEKEALKYITKNICLVIADIDLSETGGAADGGIEFAKTLAAKSSKLPFILISHAPWAFLPKANSPEYHSFVKENNIRAVLDRNDKKFRDNLIQEVKKLINTF